MSIYLNTESDLQRRRQQSTIKMVRTEDFSVSLLCTQASNIQQHDKEDT